MNKKHPPLVCLLILLACCAGFAGTLRASDLSEVRRSCLQRASLGTGPHWIEQCALDILSLSPVHPTFRTIAPGTGPGFGLGSNEIRRRGTLEIIPSAALIVSTNRSLLADARVTFGFPGLSLTRNTGPFLSAPANASDDEAPSLRGLALVSGSPAIETKAGMTFYTQRLELKKQDFYGLGPLTNQSGLALYKQRQTSAGFNITDPLFTWATIGFSLDYIRPQILPVTASDRPAVTDIYTEETAPGLADQPTFIRFGPDVRLRFEPTFLQFVEFQIAYTFNHDLDDTRYSFRQFQASGHTEYDMLIQTQNTASNRSAFSNFLCTPRPAKECSLGTLDVSAQAVLSQTGTNSRVPFYFQPTLGGADLHGQDTLRGFRDYRFRAPNLLLFQAEYRHGIKGPIGFLSFFDIGRVALESSNLGIEHMRHDIGVGLYFSAGNHILVRAYVGFGNGEGVRPNAKLAGGP